jgi:hypothetical protein
MSSEFLKAPPDQFGFLENQVFQVTLAACLGQMCPAMAPLIDQYFLKQDAKLDKYGTDVGVTALSDTSHWVLHNNIHAMVQLMMMLDGISSKKEAAHFLAGHVCKPHITRYINHITFHSDAHNISHATVPDIMVRNYLTGHQLVMHTIAMMGVLEIFEVKTYTYCKT